MHKQSVIFMALIIIGALASHLTKRTHITHIFLVSVHGLLLYWVFKMYVNHHRVIYHRHGPLFIKIGI